MPYNHQAICIHCAISQYKSESGFSSSDKMVIPLAVPMLLCAGGQMNFGYIGILPFDLFLPW